MSNSGRLEKYRIKTSWDAVQALYQLVDHVLPPEFDLADSFASAATLLAESKAKPTRFVSEAVREEEEQHRQLLELYNALTAILFNKAPLADTPHNQVFAETTFSTARDAMLAQFSEEKPTMIDELLQTLISQPDTIVTKRHGQTQSAFEIDLTKAFMQHLRTQLTPIERYNQLVATLIETPPPPLLDTETNADYAESILETIVTATERELAQQTPSRTRADIDTFIANTLKQGTTNGSDSVIQAALQAQLAPSLHTSLDIFNTLQMRFTYPELPNTVENNETAKKTLRTILETIANLDEFDQDKAEEFLSKLITTPDSDEAQLSTAEKAARAIVNEQLLMVMYPNYRAGERPDLYPRIIADLAAADTQVSLAEKISLLTELSALLADRPSHFPISTAAADPLYQALDKLGNFAEALAVNLIKRIYAMRFGEEEPELKVNQEPVANPPSVEEETQPTPATKASLPKDKTPSDEEDSAEKKNIVKGALKPAKDKMPLSRQHFNNSDDDEPVRPVSPNKRREKGERIRFPAAEQRAADDNAERAQFEKEQEEKERMRLANEQTENQQRIKEAQITDISTRTLIEQLRHSDQLPVDLLKPKKIDSDLVGVFDIDEKKVTLISSKQALHDRIFEYTTGLIALDNSQRAVSRALLNKQIATYQKTISLLLNLIQEACSFTKKALFADSSTRLTERFVQAGKVNRQLNFNELQAEQESLVKSVLAVRDIQTSKAVTAVLAQINQNTLKIDLVNTIMAFCEPLKSSRNTLEKNTATQLQKDGKALLKASQWNPAEFARLVNQATYLSALINKPTPEEKAAQDFLPKLAIINSNPDTTETTLLAAFKDFAETIMPAKTDQLIENFQQKINSPRMQQMKHIALLFLDNLERFYIATDGDKHAKKDLFNEYRSQIWELATTISEAPRNEPELLRLLSDFLTKTGHDITLHVDDQGILHETRSAAENERLQLLTLLVNYADSLKTLKKSLTPDQALQLTPITDAAHVYMQILFTLDKKRLPDLRAEIEKAAVGFEQSIQRVVDTAKRQTKAATPSTAGISRALGELNLLSETRKREKMLIDRQKALSAIFNPKPK